MGPFGGGFTFNYTSGYRDTDPNLSGNACLNSFFVGCRTASFSDVDLFGHWDVSDKVTVNAHVLNVGNKLAPFDPQAAYGQSNYNFNFASQGAVGRFYELGVKYRL